MSTKLRTGDKVYFKQNGRKLRGTVADFLDMPVRGEENKIPVIRRKECHWFPRHELRKLPSK